MKPTGLFALVLMGATISPAALAAPSDGAPSEGAKPAAMLTPADLDPGTLLPVPPAAGSVQARAELAELHAMETARSEADVAAARHDSATKNASIFAEVLGPGFDLERLPTTKALFGVVRATENDAADRAKAVFQRPRPWIVDPTLKSCARSSKPLSSYPSGHTTMAYAMGAVLARLVPAKASAIMARAAVYGQSRIVCEQHFRSDVTAGEALGLIVADRLMAKPQFAPLFAAAQAELATAAIR